MSRRATLGPRAWIAILAVAGAVAAGLQWGPGRWNRWRADRTAGRFVAALHDADSSALAGLTPQGQTRAVLCARRTWPAAYWTRAGGEPSLEQLPPGMDLGYRVLGDTLEGRGPASFLFFIRADRPNQVDRYFANLRGLPWGDAFRTCLHGG